MTARTLEGKVAIVTGGSRGIGRAIAERLSTEGASVVLSYVRNKEAAQETVAAIEASGGQALAVQADIGLVSDIHHLFAETIEQFGHLDILVNNAGTGIFAPLTEITETHFDALFALNVKGVFFALQEAARLMKDGGRIVNISAGITISGVPGGALYGGSKGAVEQFTQAVAKELAGRGITVNTVSPGGTTTELFNTIVPSEMQAHIAHSSPFGRLGKPDDIADVIAFVVSDGARWLTGQNLRATGGAN
jgi:3-oxoacyl-[acyl-carrier protein] reductase